MHAVRAARQPLRSALATPLRASVARAAAVPAVRGLATPTSKVGANVSDAPVTETEQGECDFSPVAMDSSFADRRPVNVRLLLGPRPVLRPCSAEV